MPQIWVTKLAHELQRQPIVKRVRIKAKHLHVLYHTGVYERYWYGIGTRRKFDLPLVASQAKLTKSITVARQFEADLLARGVDYDHHWMVHPKVMRRMTLVDKLLLCNRLAAALVKLGYNGRHHPSTLATCWQKLQAIDKLHCFQDGLFELRHLRPQLAGLARPIIEHFFDLGQRGEPNYQEAFRRPRLLYRALRRIVLSQRIKLTTTNLNRVLGICGAGPRLMHPALYVALLTKLNISGPVLDLHPDLGNKAIACALLGLPYLTYPDPNFDSAMADGFGDFIGLNHQRYLGGRPVDLVLADGNFKEVDFDAALQEARHAKCLVSFVPLPRYDEVVAKYKPRLTVKFMRRPSAVDYWLLW